MSYNNYHSMYYERNKERLKYQAKLYYARNRERILAKMRVKPVSVRYSQSEINALMLNLKKAKEDCGISWRDVGRLSDLTASFLVQTLKGTSGLSTHKYNVLFLLVSFLNSNKDFFDDNCSKITLNANREVAINYMRGKFNALYETTTTI